MRVVGIINAHTRNARRANRRVEIGEKLYCIQDEKTGYYFVWCYVDKAYAERLAPGLTIDNTTDLAFNWRRSFNDCVHSGRTQAVAKQVV